MQNLAYVETEQFNDINKNSTNYDNINEKIYKFEDAITLTGTGKFHQILLFVCGICFLAVMVEIMGISMIMNEATCDLKLTLYEQGFLASAGFLGVVLSSHAFGFLADTCGRVRTLKYALSFSLISSIISIFSISAWMLTILRFFVGIFISGCQACIFSYFAEFHGNKTRAKNVTLLSTFLPIALIILPALSYLILPLKIEFYLGNLKFLSWRLVLLANILPSVIAFIALQFFPESPKYLMVQGKHDEALEILKKVYLMNNNNDKEYPVKKMYIDTTGADFSKVKNILDALKLIWTQTTPLFTAKRAFHTLNFCFLNFVIFAICQGVFMWFSTILIPIFDSRNSSNTICQSLEIGKLKTLNSNETIKDPNGSHCEHMQENDLIYTVLIAAGLLYTIIYLIFSFSIDLIGKKPLLLIYITICGFCGILLYWTNNFYLNISLLIIFIGVGSAGGIINALAINFFPTNVNAMGMCLMLMIARLGAVAGSNLFGQILEYNCDLLFIIFGGITLILVPLSYLLPNYS